MKKKLTLIALSFVSVFSAMAAVVSTLAWFASGTKIAFGDDPDNVNVTGGTASEYYESGTGTSNDKYVISNKTHLYNLAWLQYIGFYNAHRSFMDTPSGDDILQCYFKLKNNIDMEGMTLPPIGTEKYPFLGNFDGQGFTVSNFTVSNDNPVPDTSDFGVAKPSNFRGGLPSDVIGFFGVVGKLPTATITFDTSVVSIANVTLKDFTIKARTTNLLIGLAGGYVDGAMSGVKIDGDAKLDLGTTNRVAKADITGNLTNYGLVGYTTREGDAGNNFSQELSSYYHSGGTAGSGTNIGEGGSISSRDYIKWLFDGPRNNNAALSAGSATSENHITVTNNYEAHYTVSNERIDPTDDYVFIYRSSNTNYFKFKDAEGVFVNGNSNYSFEWEKNTSGSIYGNYTNYKITFAEAVTINNGQYTTIYLNHYNNTSSIHRIYSTNTGSGTTNQIISTQYSVFVTNIVYRLKDNQNASVGDIHSTYVPLKFSDNNHSGVDADNTGYIVGTTLPSNTNNRGVNGSPKLGAYGTNFITNSLGTNTFTGNEIAYQGLGNSTFNDSSAEIITYSTSAKKWVVIKDTHNSAYYGNGTSPKNSEITTAGITTLMTPEQLKFKKYEKYSSDPSITETALKPLTRNSLKNIMTYTDQQSVTHSNYQMTGIHFDSYTYSGTVYGKVSNKAANKITIPKAYLNGLAAANSTQYELLKGAINFKFPKKGYVNFMAGAYNSDPTKKSDFFSIFKVVRNSASLNQISAIYEIEGVYEKEGVDGYVYKVFAINDDGNQTGNAFYIDKNDNTVNDISGYTLIFDVKKSLKCDGGTVPVENALYYFEVPINPGDYAMGLVAGSSNSGAYMLYLDIGANAELTDEVSAYSITTKHDGYSYPTGVDFAVSGAGTTGGDSFGVYIPSGKQGEVIFAITSTNINVSGATENNYSISIYKFQGTKHRPSHNDGTFTVGSTSPPQALQNVNAIERTLHISLTTIGPSAGSYDIVITDYLDSNGNILNSPASTYYVDSGSGYVASDYSTIEGLTNEFTIDPTFPAATLSKNLRKLAKAATITRTNSTAARFSTTYNVAGCSANLVDATVELNGTTIAVTVETGYQAKINGQTYNPA